MVQPGSQEVTSLHMSEQKATPVVFLHPYSQPAPEWNASLTSSFPVVTFNPLQSKLTDPVQGLQQWLDAQGIARAHMIAYSEGGAVAIRLASEAPHYVTSLTLLAAMGVQELELLGDYYLNRGLHGIKWLSLTLLRDGLPHFGLLDGLDIHVSNAKNSYETDLRPLREQLKKIQTPLLIAHGRKDIRVPQAAAIEHHRLVPQSEMLLLEKKGHALLSSPPKDLITEVHDFLRGVETGRTLTRAQAEPDRIEAADKAFDPSLLPRFKGAALWLIFGLLILSSLVSEDLTCIARRFDGGKREFIPALGYFGLSGGYFCR